MTLDEMKNSLPSSLQEDAYERYHKLVRPTQKKNQSITMLGGILNRIAGIPYLLVLLALALPFMTVKCSDAPVAEFNAYEITVGGDIRTSSLGALDQIARNIDKTYKNTSSHYDGSPWVAGMFIFAIIAAVFSFMNKAVHAIVASGVTVLYIWIVFLVGYITCRDLATSEMGMLSVSPGIGIFLAMIFIAVALIMNIIALTHKQ